MHKSIDHITSKMANASAILDPIISDLMYGFYEAVEIRRKLELIHNNSDSDPVALANYEKAMFREEDISARIDYLQRILARLQPEIYLAIQRRRAATIAWARRHRK